jgi:hypothetical protein
VQGGWSNADSDWQLKRLQHDSVKTVDKAVQTMRGVLQEDIIAHGQEYEKMFGKSSAQYNEYLNMVMEKLEQLGARLASCRMAQPDCRRRCSSQSVRNGS